MPIRIATLKLKDNTSYATGEPWPGEAEDKSNPHSKIIGPIYFRPQQDDAVSEDGEDNAVIGTVSTPAHYEVWCVSDYLFAGVFGPVFQELGLGKYEGKKLTPEEIHNAVVQLGGAITRRVIYCDQVAYIEEQWLPDEAVIVLMDRIGEMAQEMASTLQQGQEMAQSSQESANNGQPQVQQAGG